MIWDPPWAVLAPGEPAWLERRARIAVALDEEEAAEIEPSFKIAPGGSHYHALVGLDASGIGEEALIAEQLSRECAKPVFAIFGVTDEPLVWVYRNGVKEMLEVEPQDLARSLGCPLPEPPEQELPPPLRKAALLEGVLAQEALRVLEEEAGRPLTPGRYHLEDTPKGLLIADGTGGLGFAHITLSERLPQVTVYGVTASPSLDVFIVNMIQAGEGLYQFAQPPLTSSIYLPVSEIKGERTPERILAALGIPAEWFR